ncbi:hypothetical protein [Bacillus sp. II_CA]|uniref:hypothetical protein n=1 Tax=Bacillus sp. II_CA TaxID=3417451 RepID=UPI003CE6CE5F|nr:hypothetical protein [Bacillus cereus]
MRSNFLKAKLKKEYKNPVYEVTLVCPEGKKLDIKFDYTYPYKSFMHLKVSYDGHDKGAKLAWYTKEVEDMTVQRFLETLANKVNDDYKFALQK